MDKAAPDNISRMAQAFTPIMHLFHQLAGEVSRAGEFSLAQYRLLMLLYHGGPMTIKELCTQLSTAQSSASELVDRMVQQKLLRKEKDPTDRRRSRISITPRARKLLERRMAAMNDLYRRILEPLSPTEQSELVQALESILRLLRKSEPSNHL